MPSDLWLILADHGTRSLAISSGSINSRVRTYRIDYLAAIDQVLQAWHAQGIRQVVIPSRQSDFAGFPQAARHCQQHNLEAKLMTPSNSNYAAFIHKLGRITQTGIYLADDLTATNLFSWEAPAMCQLMQKRRVLSQQHLDCYPIHLHDETVDLALINWNTIASKIADDILHERTSPQPAPATTQAAPLLNAPAIQFTHEF